MAYCVVVKAQNSCKNPETGLLCHLILRQAHTEAHGLIVWGRVLEWCLKSFWYISHPIKSMPHYGIGIWLSVELDERCLWLGGSHRWRSSHRFDPQISQPCSSLLHRILAHFSYLPALPFNLFSLLPINLPPPPLPPRPGPWPSSLSSSHSFSRVWSSHISSIST